MLHHAVAEGRIKLGGMNEFQLHAAEDVRIFDIASHATVENVARCADP